MFLTSALAFGALQIAAAAFCFSNILTKPKFCFSWYYSLLEKLLGFKYGFILAYPLGYCEKCLGGQIALWFYIFFLFDLSAPACATTQLILFTSVTIFLTDLINRLYEKLFF